MTITDLEVEAACRAFHEPELHERGRVYGWDDHAPGVKEKCRQYMRAALEAAARVRAQKTEG